MAVRRLTDEQLAEVLALARKADGIELKLTVPASDQRATVGALRLDPLEAQIRQVYFFDTPALDLYGAGVVVRARRIQGRPGDAVVKLRPVDPGKLPDQLARSPDVVVEVDAMPGGFVCSAALKKSVGAAAIRDAALGKAPIRKLFSKDQRRLFAAHVPDGLDLDDLAVLGPMFVLKQTWTPKKLGRRLVAELWLYPDGSRILELSTKCSATDALRVAEETRAFLAGRGVNLHGRQETKTKAALAFYSKQLVSS